MVQSAVSARVCLPRVGGRQGEAAARGAERSEAEGLLGTKKSFIKLYS